MGDEKFSLIISSHKGIEKFKAYFLDGENNIIESNIPQRGINSFRWIVYF